MLNFTGFIEVPFDGLLLDNDNTNALANGDPRTCAEALIWSLVLSSQVVIKCVFFMKILKAYMYIVVFASEYQYYLGTQMKISTCMRKAIE